MSVRVHDPSTMSIALWLHLLRPLKVGFEPCIFLSSLVHYVSPLIDTMRYPDIRSDSSVPSSPPPPPGSTSPLQSEAATPVTPSKRRQPVVHQSPPRKRRKKSDSPVHARSDTDVWSLSNDEIIGVLHLV